MKTGQESKNMCSILGMQYNASELETKLEHDGRARANKQQQRQQDAWPDLYWREEEVRDLGLGVEREEEEQCEGVKDGGRRKSRNWIYRGEERRGEMEGPAQQSMLAAQHM